MACLSLLSKVKKALRAKTIKPGERFAITLDNALAGKVINKQEHAKLADYNVKRERAIRVDEFDFEMNLLDENAQPLNAVKDSCAA
jgi:acyl-CoA dehydrogenase